MMKFIKISDGSPYPGDLPDPVKVPVLSPDGKATELRTIPSNHGAYRNALMARMFMVGYELALADKAPVRKAADKEPAETIALAELQNAIVELAEKKKGPGPGWWGPPRGSHVSPKGMKMTDFSGSSIQTTSIKLKKKLGLSTLKGWKGERAAEAVSALRKINDGMPGILLRERGETTAIASYSMEKGTLWVESLATKMSGRGRAAMGYIVRSAQREGATGIKLLSADAAKGFYVKIGMKESRPNVFNWSMDEAETFLATVEKAVKMSEEEPEDGIFVAPRKVAQKKAPVRKANDTEDAAKWAKAVEAWLRAEMSLDEFEKLTSYQQHLEVNKLVRLFAQGTPLKEEWKAIVSAYLKSSDYPPARMAATYVEEHVSALLKAEHGPRLPEETWEGVEDGSPLAPEHYKCWRRYGMRPRWQKGWVQLHWRGMPEKDPADIANHSVHCDLRLQWGDELVQWVLTGKQDKLLRVLKGENDPSTGKTQNAMALVKPAAEEAAERIEAERLVKEEILKIEMPLVKARPRRDKCMDCSRSPTVEVLWAEGMAHAWFCDKCFKKWKAEHGPSEGSASDIDSVKVVRYGIARKKFSERTSPRSLDKAELLLNKAKLALPLRGYWIEPQDPANPFPTWAYVQTVDTFEWRPGAQRRDFHEIFVRGARYGIVKGRFILRALAGGRPRRMPGKPEKEYRVYWLFMRPPDQKAADPLYHRDSGTVVPIKVWRVRRSEKGDMP